MEEDWSDLTQVNLRNMEDSLSYVEITDDGVLKFAKSFMQDVQRKREHISHVSLSYSEHNRSIALIFHQYIDTDIPYSAGRFFYDYNEDGVACLSSKTLFSLYKLDLDVVSGKYIPYVKNIAEKKCAWVIRLNEEKTNNQGEQDG